MSQRWVRPAPVTTKEELVAATERDGVEFLFAMFVDMHGKPCAKMVPVSAIDGLMADGAGFAGFAAGPDGPDRLPPPTPGHARPQLVHARPVAPRARHHPMRPLCARRAVAVRAPGHPAPADRPVGRLRLTLKVGAEAEYFLVRRSASGGIEVADPLDQAKAPCYDARALTRMYDHLTTVSRHMNTLGWSNYANDHEDANGQFEQNFKYADAMTTADRVIVFRYMIHSLAAEAGMLATFMPKPFSNLTGNGLHMHLSMWDDDGSELFADPADSRGLGMSTMGYSFVGGLLEHAQALAAVACPTVNSYKRLASPAPDSGAAWSPVFATYGGNDRTHMLRVPDPGRVEDRCIDGSANPYLTMSALIAAGLDGIEREVNPGEPCELNLLKLTEAEAQECGLVAMPMTLWHALDHLETDGVLREGLGKTPEGDYVDYFVATKRAEARSAHAEVTSWEFERYLSTI